MILPDHIDDGGDFVGLESRAAESAHSVFECVGILRGERGNLGCDDFARDRIWPDRSLECPKPYQDPWRPPE